MAIWMLLHLNSLCRIWLLHLIISNRRQAIMSLSPFLSVSDFHVTSVCRRLFINHLSSDCWEVEYVISNQKLRWDIYKPHSLMVSSNSNPAKTFRYHTPGYWLMLLFYNQDITLITLTIIDTHRLHVWTVKKGIMLHEWFKKLLWAFLNSESQHCIGHEFKLTAAAYPRKGGMYQLLNIKSLITQLRVVRTVKELC